MVVLSVIPKSGIRETRPDGTFVIDETHYDEISQSSLTNEGDTWYAMTCIEGYTNPTAEVLKAHLPEPGACLDEPFELVVDIGHGRDTFELKPVTDKSLAERLMKRTGILG